MIVLDSGAVSFFSRQSPRSDGLLAALRREGPLAVPAVVLVECLTGTARDAAADRLLKACTVLEDVPVRLARRAAALRAAAGRGSAVDALVVAYAEHGVAVTGDRDDIAALASHARDVIVIAI